MTREIPLSRGMVALVDDDDYHRVVAAGPWYADQAKPGSPFYARKNFVSAGRWTAIRMQAFILGAPLVDHANGDTLDNRRCNLRPATSRQNAQNRGIRSDNSSGFKGVSWHKQSRKWRAEIQIPGRRRCLGGFRDPEQAARAYDAAALTHFGEFARLNFPQEKAS